MMHYLLQAIVIQFVLLIAYDVLYKRETFYGTHRWYLLVSPILSLILPLLTFEALRTQIPSEYLVQLPALVIDSKIASGSEGESAVLPISLKNFAYIVWFLGSVTALLLWLLKYSRLRRYVKNGNSKEAHGIAYIEVPNCNNGFTFLGTIYLGDAVTESQRKVMLQHEQVHVTERHGWDLCYFELLRILFWFNPLVYLYQRRVAEIHEYTADSHVARLQGKSDYYQGLLSQLFQTNTISFVNTFFNQSLIKKRIARLRKDKSKKTHRIKYLLLLPLLFGIICYTSCTQESSEEQRAEVSEQFTELQKVLETNGSGSPSEQRQIKTLLEKQSTDEDASMETQRSQFSNVHHPPIFPGCAIASAEEANSCFVQKVTEFVVTHFDTSVGDALAMEGTQRIVLQFKINTEGNVMDEGATAKHPELVEEAVRVIRKLPQMQAGKQQGKAVNTAYTLPIIFSMDE